jgi:prepilin-type N-terminal cleavage/methylation domain-containing protein
MTSTPLQVKAEMMKATLHTDSAFTLIELLVVLAIIGILAALFLTPLSRAKEKARKATCINNLRQITTAVRLYADDSNASVPPSGQNPYGVWTAYKKFMKHYVALHGASSAHDSVFTCPADTWCFTDFEGSRLSGGEHSRATSDCSSYVCNAGNYHSNFQGIAGRRLTTIKEPSKTILLAEAPALWPYSWHDPHIPGDSINVCHFNNARNVVSFVDGHVSYIKMYLDTKNVAVGHEEAWHYNPPAEYDYKWSPD